MTETAPKNWAPQYNHDGDLVEHAKTIRRDGFEVGCTWTTTGGYGAFIDHDNDEAFTMPQLRQLVSVLQDYLREYDDE